MLTNTITDVLSHLWLQTFQPFKISPLKLKAGFKKLVQAYSSAGRYYHTLQHIHYLLQKIQSLQAYTQDLPSVEIAAWFHDVIYDTQFQDNEEKSADYADEVLNNLGIPTSYITKVKRLILNTKHHQANDIDSQLLLDADLAILAADPVDYQEYANAIRQEYAWVSDDDYIKGRTQVLEKFLQRQRIYFTPLMYEKSEQAARNNLQMEINILNDIDG